MGLTKPENRTYDLLQMLGGPGFQFRPNRLPGSPRIANSHFIVAAGSNTMSKSNRCVLAFSPPTSDEQDALALSAAYLRRAGNEAASRLLSADSSGTGKTELIATLRDDMRDSAALCECLITLFDSWDWNGHDRPRS